MDDWHLDEKSLGKWHVFATLEMHNLPPPNPPPPHPSILQGMTKNVGLTFSVGDTILQFIIRIGDTKYHI